MRRLLRRLLGRGVAPQDAHGVRWVVIDCEASGLDPARERLLELGAVAVRAGRIEPADSFHARLRQEAPSAADNILVHGIGADAQRSGRPAPEALRSFAHYLGAGLPVAFHAEFDAVLLGRALGSHGLKIAAPWLDLAQLAPALYPERARAARSLDEWLESCGIAAPGRHGALEDAFSTAQLLLVLLGEAARQRADTVAELRHIARGARWLAPR